MVREHLSFGRLGYSGAMYAARDDLLSLPGQGNRNDQSPIGQQSPHLLHRQQPPARHERLMHAENEVDWCTARALYLAARDMRAGRPGTGTWSYRLRRRVLNGAAGLQPHVETHHILPPPLKET
jgi:hypothetical protein